VPQSESELESIIEKKKKKKKITTLILHYNASTAPLRAGMGYKGGILGEEEEDDTSPPSCKT
jgi:hypothetical protein